MRKLFVRSLICTFLLAAGAAELGAANDLRSTKHNLGGRDAAVDAREVCVFCHTPSLTDNSGSDSPGEPGAGRGAAVVQEAPRWQPSLAGEQLQSFEFGIYDDIGRGVGVGSQSVACLSCHDSTQAFGIEGGNYDHPFGIPYRGAYEHSPLNASSESLVDTALRRGSRPKLESLDFKPPRRGTINNREVWWVPTSESSVARTRQDIPLYLRQRPNAVDSATPYLECSSCHDPHSGAPLFMRVSAEGSRLCLSCHEK